MKRLLGGASVVVSLLSIGMALAQVTATQGEKPKIESAKNEFHSPMILVVSAEQLRKIPIGEEWEVQGLDTFICDDVSISRLKIARKLKAWWELADSSNDFGSDGPFGIFTAEIRTYTRPSYDRLVDVTLELLRGEDIVSTWAVKDIETEEGKFGSATAYSRVMPPKDLESSLEGDQPLRLRLTVMVKEG